MPYVGVEKFGSFAVDGYLKPMPDKPWFTNNYPGSLSDRGKGTISAIETGQEIQMRNTDSNPNYQISWVHIKDGNKHIYISTKVLATNVSWNYLNERNMIYGRSVTIDGKAYKQRVLTGGDLQNQNNEWDTIIRNTANITGLPKPTQEDLTNTNTYGQLDGDHNQLWNWWGIRTICQETLYNRGYTGASGIISSSPPERSPALGWRPVLEYIEIDPPGKPIPVYPTSEDRTHPEPIQGEITLQTKYNGEGSLELMDVFVYNYTQQEFEYKSGEVANTTGAMQLPVTFKAGNNYKITVRHKGTGGIAKGWLELYVIGG
ncbi:hypothetical protein CF061_21140, partial [Clostridium botulinum]|nr:hypothetical protein [Clostridium botulinum]